MRKPVHIIIWLLLPFFAASQQYYIKGRVSDEAGNALQNASIKLYSTGYMYSTGTEGTFGILSKAATDTIVVSREGFQRLLLPINASEFIEVRLKKQVVVKSSSTPKLASLTQNLTREIQQQWFAGEETYASLIENQFITAGDYPTTTVTLNSDRASYSNIRRFLSLNSVVPPDAVRLDEMLNYFNFSYKEPEPGKCFSIQTTLTSCPWNKNNNLIFTHISGRKLNLDTLPASHFVFLIDVSGSMDMPNRLPVLKSGFKSLVKNLRPKDSVSIVVYGGAVGIALPITGGDEKEKIFHVIDSLQAGGSTPGASGIKMAYRIAKDHFIKDGNNRIVLATDGDFNVGLKTEGELEELIAAQRDAGIYLTCLGIGMGNYKDSKIQTLAQKGNGNFAYIDSYAEADKILLQEFTQTLYSIADDAVLKVDFDPELIRNYRLIGFDNRITAMKDSASKIEGGEIGSGYSTLIVFEIEPAVGLKAAYQPMALRLDYKNPVTSEKMLLEDKPNLQMIPFNKIAPSEQFASALIMFGSLLRKSKMIKASWNDVSNIAKMSADKSFSQQEFLTLVEQAKRVYSKKRRKEE